MLARQYRHFYGAVWATRSWNDDDARRMVSSPGQLAWYGLPYRLEASAISLKKKRRARSCARSILWCSSRRWCRPTG